MGNEDDGGKKQTVAVKLEPATIEEIDNMVDGEEITNRSQAIRELINAGLQQDRNRYKNLVTFATTIAAFGAFGLLNNFNEILRYEFMNGAQWAGAFLLVGFLGWYLFAWVKA